MRRTLGMRLALAGMVAAALLIFGPHAWAISKAEAKAKIEKMFRVEVLKIREIISNGRPAYAVTVMNPGGDFNEAFQVNTIVIDRETGQLVPQFRHRGAGYSLSDTLDRNVGEDFGPRTRRMLGR